MFEWDENKNASNIAKHGIDFETAIRIFEREVLCWQDIRMDYSEYRQISIGRINFDQDYFGEASQPSGKEAV